ncbi:hypothetical protein BU14_0933s0008 [Porphyra umbilicalis]|uniref:Uncharacterized protein n=1 Tax=Porphyra umbilicalis TaxID=2786 RepID=A0A1X6NNA1_PORUM|nr:hypothetical protein BU14_0933s0008 [Porphyra umbilicalis]|eukprot:OSX70068.1 hypothetical protein BU14_0933s0008 [Porphyra umbilicalis]
MAAPTGTPSRRKRSSRRSSTRCRRFVIRSAAPGGRLSRRAAAAAATRRRRRRRSSASSLRATRCGTRRCCRLGCGSRTAPTGGRRCGSSKTPPRGRPKPPASRRRRRPRRRPRRRARPRRRPRRRRSSRRAACRPPTCFGAASTRGSTALLTRTACRPPTRGGRSCPKPRGSGWPRRGSGRSSCTKSFWRRSLPGGAPRS